MKSILSVLFVFCSVKYSVAQSLAPDVISSGGTSFVNGSKQLDWTLGQIGTSTLTDGTYLLSQGFQQNYFKVTAIDNFDSNYGVSVFPNPTADIIQIQPKVLHNENYSIELYTTEGKLLSTQLFNFNTRSQIDMTNFNNGTYLLKIVSKDEGVKSYQILKIK